MDDLLLSSGKLLILGDFNYHMDSMDDKCVNEFKNCLYSYSLLQHIDKITHEKGHILDLAITRVNEITISQPIIDFSIPSDHYAVLFRVNISHESNHSVKVVTGRNFKKFDLNKFRADVASTFVSNLSFDSDPTVLVSEYNNKMKEHLDHHAPMKQFRVRDKSNTPWYSGIIYEAMKERKRLERRWLRSGMASDFKLYKKQRNTVQRLLERNKREWFHTEITSASQQDLFKVTK